MNLIRMEKKGDVEKMKEEIKQEDRQQFERDGNVFAVLFFATLLTPIPLMHYLGYAGIGIWAVLACVTFLFALRVEKRKKEFDIQTYKEILAFSEGKGLDEIEKAKEEGKRPYQKILLAAASALFTLAISVLMIWIFGI